jgi:CheY-like chemotaxis protein
MIEDDRASSDLFSAYLEGTGITVIKARNGREGLARIRQSNPSAVLLDIRLPGMDGWEVLAALKSDPATSAIPVVVVSIVDEGPRGRALGASEYLVKPVRRDDLLAALDRVGVGGQLGRSGSGMEVS